ncbi:MAG: gamma-glutamyl-gamma-aminobutyrate hydrolase family protein [Candidatus Dormibacteraeota bacterium]|nr:gamma-glutamyl-gamma-aminobutyrate hydrolase family protein [Candidatus Dormibacteraeota bacterium]
MARPAVGVTWSSDLVGRSAHPGENALKYLALLAQAGTTPVLLTPGTSTAVLGRLDGLLLPGGPDIEPWRYGQEPGGLLEAVDAELDALELEFVEGAQARRRPVLGICRGQQLLNVALGGTLHQHVVHPQWDHDPSTAVHEVRVEPGTFLQRSLGVDTAAVNSGHHQAVDVVAVPLRVAARSPDGVVEALENEDRQLLSVQWHPEEMRDADVSRRLVAGFVRWMGLDGGELGQPT